MRFIKVIFAIVVPLLLIACIITRTTRHVTLRQTFDYLKSSYSLTYQEFTDSLNVIQERINNFKNSATTKPESDPNTPLENIWRYIVWFANLFAGFFATLYGLLEGLFRLIYFLLSLIITTFRVILYFFGLITT